jgi:long-subunit fatty acid transport protein
MSFRSNARLVLSVVLLAVPRLAEAGGLEMPDLGTEALGRGAAFTAKADDPTAIHYNVAGLAQQRGTRLLVNANVSQSSLRFQRDGVYTDDLANPATPWGGRRYPKVDNEGKPLMLPFLAATSDLGLDFLTVALSVHAPPLAAYAGRTYPLAVDGAPSPARYDSVGGTSSVVLFYTGAVGIRVSEAIDVGVAVHAVQASIETRTVSYVDMTQCKNAEYQPCDGRSEGSMTGWTATGSAGALARLGAGVTSGLHVRGPVMMQTEGTAQTTTPRVLGGTATPPARMALRNALPLVARAGVRKAFYGAGGKTEAGDIELDVTYERWSDAQDPGPRALLEKLGTTKNAALTVMHAYRDTFSVRLGGAYNFAAGTVPLTLRAGAFYDGSATEPAHTRIDADTLAKVAGTVGASARFGSFAFNVAYAGVYDVPRTVEDGAVRPINAARGGATEDSEGNLLPAVNNGTYDGFTHVLSLGLTVELDLLLGFGRRAAAASAPSTQGRSAVGARL